MAVSSYLVQRGSSFHFRAVVPLDLRARLGRTELRVSLGSGRVRDSKDKALFLAAFVRRMMRDIRGGAMAELTSEEISTIVRDEFRRILEEDKRSRKQLPGQYTFEVRWDLGEKLKEDWRRTDDVCQLDKLSTQEADKKVRNMLYNEEWAEFAKPVIELAKRHGFDISSDIPTTNEMCFEYAHAMVEVLSAIRKRENGHTDFTPEVFLDDQPKPEQQNPNGLLQAKDDRKLSTLIREYSDEKKRHGWTERSERTIMERLNSLTELMGDVELEKVDHDFAFKFRKLLMDKPKKRQSKQAKASGITEAIAVGTVNNIITDIAAMFKWAKKRRWITDNYFEEMTVSDKTPAHLKKQSFTKEELSTVFGSNFLPACKNIPWRFWIPVLGLFTGARLDEIAQAKVDDVREIDGIWCLVVESSEDKSVKTASGNRNIPLHPFIVHGLRFLSFVNQQRANGETELFPGLKRVQGRKGHYASKWFGEYRDKLNIPKTKTLHSLRKNFTKNLAIHDVPANMIKRLDGHSLSNDVTEHHYIQDIPVYKLAEYIKKLNYGLDLSHLEGSKFVVGL
ncbi:site-specific integrase [Solidesulfovibrio magneticus]|uniref:Site-specific recombinase n=1 Tax=Solidesulfovibrio magneticus (strain ATCC 700980 / DSM 13731 / RS-1) TaxID=573370 RepID=C4XT97_SOLM1|nr:site-specific integrase [Solidesulfovibrio magneticus]BAH75894.1 putative site-specific recombinase [Solidesulfovibrio magneticus RS-1]